jgi:SAM-dependent methyltransferase
MVSQLDLSNEGQSILEIGCGPGYALKLICKKNMKLDIFAIDHSFSAISFARKANSACRINFLQINAEAIDSLPVEKLDRVFAANSHQFWKDEDLVFSKIHKKLNKDGKLVIVFQPRCNSPSNKAADDEGVRLKNKLSAVGFSEIKLIELDLKPVKAICIIASKGPQ